jgi:hypothetical protein
MVSTDMLARRRQRLLVIAAFGYLLWQLAWLALAIGARPGPALLAARLAGFLIFAGALGAIFVWAKAARCRAALDDEMTRHNRLRAFTAGFWAMLIAAAALFAAGQFVAIPGAEAARMVMIAGVVVPLLRFALLERSA